MNSRRTLERADRADVVADAGVGAGRGSESGGVSHARRLDDGEDDLDVPEFIPPE